MGQGTCCSANLNEKSFLTQQAIKVVSSAEVNVLKNFLPTISSIDAKIIYTKEGAMSLLAYSFLIGNMKAFSYLIKKNASIEDLFETLDRSNIDMFYYLCDRGYIELLSFMMPRFCKTYLDKVEESRKAQKYNGNAHNGIREKIPIQRACAKGHISVVLYIYKFFEMHTKIPEAFDIETVNKVGENCAFIACRIGNFPLIKSLHKLCNANFLRHNNFHETSLMACLSGYKFQRSSSYTDCVIYLIESVKVDITYLPEELLILAEDKYIIEFIEQKLRDQGITLNKKDIEKANKIKRSIAIDEGVDCSDYEKMLEKMEVFQQISDISSISCCRSRSVSASSFAL